MTPATKSNKQATLSGAITKEEQANNIAITTNVSFFMILLFNTL